MLKNGLDQQEALQNKERNALELGYKPKT